MQAGSLEIGERLQTLSGDVKVVQQKRPRPGPEPVFNLEVHAEHVYFVGEDGVLVHNSQSYTGPTLRKNANGEWQILAGPIGKRRWHSVNGMSTHGNARSSPKPQVGYVVIDRRTGAYVKVGVVEAAKGVKARLAEQADHIVQLAKKNGYSVSAGDLDVLEVKHIGARAGARGQIYDWERSFSGFLLNSGNKLPGHSTPRVPFW